MPILPNPRHERLAQLIATGKSATEAMQTVGYSDPRNSTRLTKKDEIRQRIIELQQRGGRRAEISIARLVEELEEARQHALALRNPAAMVSATMGKARISGLLINKAEIGEPNAFEAMSEDELRSYITHGDIGGTLL